MTNITQILMELKIAAMKEITKYPATFHAIDVALQIAGWEEAATLGDNSFDLAKKIHQIYKNEVDRM